MDVYHSGIEGYCKTAAKMLGNPASRDSWLPLCKEILSDRTKNTLTRVWKLSNQRHGRSCRLTLFEKCWLDVSYKTYQEEARSLYEEGEVPTQGYRTIKSGSTYQDMLQNAFDKSELDRMATQKCEADAIEACVDNLVRLAASSDDTEDASPFVSLVLSDNFAVGFYTQVMPAIEQGFYAERYSASDVRQFLDALNNLLEAAQFGLRAQQTDYEPLRRLAKSLFAALVYGPGHPMATDNSPDATSTYFEFEGKQHMPGTSIRLTQVFSKDLLHTGMSVVCGESDVVFLGRSNDEDLFVRECGKAHGRNVQKVVAKRSKVLFTIHDTHEAVSNQQGMLLCENGAWWYYDIDSHNGTSIQSSESIVPVQSVIKVLPGDLIRLGAPANTNADDLNVYNAAAVLRVTHHVDEGKQLYE